MVKLPKPDSKVLDHIEKIASLKNKEIDRRYFIKYNYLNDIAINVIRLYKNDVLLYGGTAINEIVSAKQKFYGEDEMSDIDIFCTEDTSKKLSADLIKAFKNNNHELTTVNEALHENTYKLIVEGLMLTDITVIDTDSFKKFSNGKILTSIGLYSVNIDYLRYSLHFLLAKPYDSSRWIKAYPRLISLYNDYPVSSKCETSLNEFYLYDIPSSLLKKLPAFLKKNSAISFGWDIIENYIKESKNDISLHEENFSPIQYISVIGDSHEFATALSSHLNNADIAILKQKDASVFLPEYSVITYKNEKWIYIFKAYNCLSFVTYKNTRILSIHSMIYYMYCLYFTTLDTHILCVIHILTNILLANLKSKKAIFQQFLKECYGDNEGLVTLRKNKFERLLKKKQHQ